MKFRKITIKNFMRYKGMNTMEFSCDPEKNVTVVMGDNTFGKTTLAQAFRWGLYGEVIDTQYAKGKDKILLNKDVLASMTNADEEIVSVEIEVQEKNIIYQFKREATFNRKFPMLEAKEIQHKLWMRRKVENEMWGDWIDNESTNRNKSGSVEENIKMMFPRELSNYFLFDGERWSNENKSKIEIRNSISSLMGITPLVKMKEHLYNGNSKSVIKSLNGKISGNGQKFDEIKNRIKYKEEQIEKWEREIEEAKKNVKLLREKIENSQNMLESNIKIEAQQKEYKKLEDDIERQQKRIKSDYADMIKIFSKDAYKYFAAPLLEEVVDMLKSVDLEGKDIPGVTGATIDYLLEQSTCICGNHIGEKEKGYMEELRKVIYPNIIGSYVGNYQEKFVDWRRETNDFKERICEKADNIEGTKAQMEEDEETKNRLEKLIDGKINFSQERQKMRVNKRYETEELEKIRKNELNIGEAKRTIEEDRKDLMRETAHTAENRRIQRMIAYANALYQLTESTLKKKEEPLMDELNAIIKEKFAEMFREQEKFAQIEEDYKLHLYYKNMGDGEPIEELSLSEGEIIARNFVFIVSILELAQKKKKEALDAKEESDVINLPLVLDGPFSKLGDINTGLIAKVLPEAAEQVIVFMLDKDWEASGLEKYTLPEYCYSVKKDIDQNSASLERK